MENGNKNVCWGCRASDHCIWNCLVRRLCRRCGNGFVTLMNVVHVKESMGKLFYGCTVRGCKSFEWAAVPKPKQEDPKPKAKDEGQSSGDGSTKASSSKSKMEDLSRIFSTVAVISKEKDVEVSLTATFRNHKS